jgi:type I restriction enzyme R subunit
LLTAEERVNTAFERVAKGQQFTREQQQWLDRVRAHLVENLSIDKDDFDTFPIFERAGGWSRAAKVFSDQLSLLIERFNEAIAA